MRLPTLSLLLCLTTSSTLYAMSGSGTPTSANSALALPDGGGLALPDADDSDEHGDSNAAVPASDGSSAPDPVDLKDIRYFSQVFQVVKQSYVEPVSNAKLMRAAIDGMLSELDPHSAYLDKQGLAELDEDTTGQYNGLGIEVMQANGVLKIIAPIDDTPASRAGIKPGDIILKLNGKTVTPDNIDSLYDQLRGDVGSKVTLTILHAKSQTPISLQLVRERISMSSVKLRELALGYVYIRLSQFQDDTASELKRKLARYIAKHGQPQGAVLDLRSNPGGLLTAAVGVADDLLNTGTIVTTRGRLSDANMRFDAHPGDQLAGAPMVVLVDNGTASAAEIVSGALKDNHRALIIGRRTFGKGVVQTVLPLDDEHAVKITTARYYTPNGTSIQAEGIQPDIVLPDVSLNQASHTESPYLIDSEADLPNHLANQDAGTRRGGNPRQNAEAQARKLAINDFPLFQALNVLQGMVVSRHGGGPNPR